MVKTISESMFFLALLCCSAMAASPEAGQHFDVEGIDMEIHFNKVEKNRDTGQSTGNAINAQFSFTDKRNGKGLPQLHPKIWLSLRRSEHVSAETSCKAKIKGFLGRQLATRADIDMNSYSVVTLNQDNSITFIDPQVAWSGGKLRGIVQLPAQGMDWALTKDGKWLYVTMPSISAVGVINTIEHNLIKTISTGEGSKPGRIVISPDGESVWVGLDSSNQVAVIDLGDTSKVKRIETGMGLHQLAFTPDGKLALITNTDANTVSVIDAREQKKRHDIAVGTTALKPVWMPKAERFYVLSVNDAKLSVIDPYQQKIETTVNVSRGNVEAAADPDGRFLWLVNQVENKAYVIDTATNTTVAYIKLVNDPDQIAFTADYAYFRGIGSEKFVLVNRKQLDELASNAKQQNSGIIELSATQVQAGEKPPSALPEAINVAGMIAPIPDKTGVMIASAPSKTIYYYVEGMMVPMGTVDNYKRSPRALMILNRGLRETASGVFEASVDIVKPGIYDVAVLIDQPRIAHCTNVALEATTESGQKSASKSRSMISADLLPLPFSPQAGKESALKFFLHDKSNGKPLSGIHDARILAFEPPGLWQQRMALEETEPGIYQTTVSFPHAGIFNVLVEAKSKGLEFHSQTMQTVKVQESLSAGTSGNQR